MTKKQHWVLYGMCWSMYPIIHSSVSRKMSTWEEWRVGPYHQPRSTAHPPPHQSAVLCGRWLHQWVEQDMVTTKIWWPALYLNKDLLVLKLFVHFFANCSLLYSDRTGTGLKCLSKYDFIKLPPPTSTPNDDAVGKEGWGGENVSNSDGVILVCSLIKDKRR